MACFPFPFRLCDLSEFLALSVACGPVSHLGKPDNSKVRAPCSVKAPHLDTNGKWAVPFVNLLVTVSGFKVQTQRWTLGHHWLWASLVRGAVVMGLGCLPSCLAILGCRDHSGSTLPSLGSTPDRTT